MDTIQDYIDSILERHGEEAVKDQDTKHYWLVVVQDDLGIMNTLVSTNYTAAKNLAEKTLQGIEFYPEGAKVVIYEPVKQYEAVKEVTIKPSISAVFADYE